MPTGRPTCRPRGKGTRLRTQGHIEGLDGGGHGTSSVHRCGHISVGYQGYRRPRPVWPRICGPTLGGKVQQNRQVELEHKGG